MNLCKIPAFRLLVLAAVTSCAVQCGDDAGGGGETAGDGREQPADAGGSAEPPAEGSFLWFSEQGARRGLSGVNHCGDPKEKRYAVEEIGSGAALFDCDGDGDLDAYVVDGCSIVPPDQVVEADPRRMPPATEADWKPAFDGQSRLYLNDGDGFFTDVTEESGAGYRGFGSGVTAADFDNDGDQDLYLTVWGPNRLLRNEGGARFVDVTETAGVGDHHWSAASCWLDFDQDGHLDLYVSNYFALTTAVDPDVWNKVKCPHHELEVACGPKTMVGEPDTLYHNRGDGTFADVSSVLGIRDVESRYGLGVVAFDFDRDGWTDIYVANDSRANYLFQFQHRAGKFKEVSDLIGVAVNSQGIAQAGMGIACGDYDGDADLDLHLTNFSHDNNTLYENDVDLGFSDVTRRINFGQSTYFALGWGTEFVDFDGDGHMDLFVCNGHVYPEADLRAPELTYKQLNRVFRNTGRRLNDVTQKSGPGLERLASSRGAAFGDVDRDGDVDVLVVELNERPSLIINESPGATEGWVSVSVEGTGKINRDGIGTQIVVSTGKRQTVQEVRSGHSFASCNSRRLSFGTGDAAKIDSLEVIWPGGERQVFSDLKVDRHYHLKYGDDNLREGS